MLLQCIMIWQVHLNFVYQVIEIGQGKHYHKCISKAALTWDRITYNSVYRLHWEKQAVHVAMSLTSPTATLTQPLLARVSPPGSPKQLCDSHWLTHHDCLLFKWSNMCIHAIRHFCKRSRKRNMRRRNWLVSVPWDESTYVWSWGWCCLTALFVTRLVSPLREVSALTSGMKIFAVRCWETVTGSLA